LRGYTYLLPMVADGSEKLTLEALKSARPPAANGAETKQV
jgi:hypothetical protein